MKLLKIIGIVLLSIICLFLIVALFLPAEFHMERSIVINTPADTLFNFILDFNNRATWDPWLAIEPDAESIIIGSNIGSKWEWNGSKIGQGTLTIKKTIPNKTIQSQIIFLAPQQGEANTKWTFIPTRTGTKATWTYHMKNAYPFDRWGALFLEDILAPFYEDGLKRVKGVMED